MIEIYSGRNLYLKNVDTPHAQRRILGSTTNAPPPKSLTHPREFVCPTVCFICLCNLSSKAFMMTFRRMGSGQR